MHNPGDDNELDQLSREAADKYEAPGLSSWDSIERELDKVLPVTEKRKKRFLFFWWLIPCLLLGGVAYWWLEQSNKPAVPLPVTKQTDLKTTITATMKEEGEKNQPITSYAASVKEHQALLNSSIISIQPSDNPVLPNKEGNEKETIFHRLPANKHKAADSKTDQPADNALNEPATKKDSTGTTLILNSEGKLQQATSQPARVNNKNKFIPMPQKKFSIGLFTGVDLSTVKFAYSSDIGYNIGLLGGYHFNNRWSLHTGVAFTQKNYKVNGPDFTAPKGTPISNYWLDTVEGYCHMWEIPLLVRYTFAGRSPYHFFASTGLSSYFMKQEGYDYYYHYNGQPGRRSSTYHTGNNYILSIAHLSAGFEKRIGQNLSVQVEPYAKIPLTGIGFGNIRLSSFGVNLAVQYRQSYHK